MEPSCFGPDLLICLKQIEVTTCKSLAMYHCRSAMSIARDQETTKGPEKESSRSQQRSVVDTIKTSVLGLSCREEEALPIPDKLLHKLVGHSSRAQERILARLENLEKAVTVYFKTTSHTEGWNQVQGSVDTRFAQVCLSQCPES